MTDIDNRKLIDSMRTPPERPPAWQSLAISIFCLLLAGVFFLLAMC